MMNLIKNFLLILLALSSSMVLSQNCTVNAGGNATICGTSYTLSGNAGGSTGGAPTWSLVSKPAGAPDPVISNIHSYTPNVMGMTTPGNYVFQITQPCTSGAATSQVTITVPGDVSTFTAGPDITNISALTGIATLAGVVPPGYTASWTYYNIYNKEYYSQNTTTNATMSGSNTATPTLSLIKKTDHDIDPAYRAVLRITSVNNPNCWYEDDAIVRFVPNPQIILPANYSRCYPPTDADRYIYLNAGSPMFATNTANSSGNPAFGTTITVNVISQPSGANISFSSLRNNILFLNGVNTIGTYKFTLTVSNANGTYTTPEITYNYNGAEPNNVSFLDPAYPEQMQVYNASGSGGAVYCNKAGGTDPITFYFKINPSDPATITTTASNAGIAPPGGSPTLALNGSGTMSRSVVVTPPAGGWRAGTYRIRLSAGNGTCSTSQDFYIHISDGNRPDVKVDDFTVCYPGSGIVTATVPLPEVYKSIVNSSYFQDFNARYDFTLVSKPAGAANPTYEATNLRTFTNTSTVISNLNKAGEYVFKIKAVPNSGGADPGFLEKEYACSGASLEDTFSIFVSTQVNANAGSDLDVIGISDLTLNGNNPGVATGTWTLVSKPSGAPDPVIENPSLYNTNVTGLINSGTYTFRWTISTGSCTNEDTMDITVAEQCENNSATVFYSGDNSGNRYLNTPTPGNNLLPFVTVSNIAGGTFGETINVGQQLNTCPVIAGITYFQMSGITGAVQANKYYSFNITTASSAPLLHFNRLSAITPVIYTSGGSGVSQTKVSYHLRVAIIDPDTSDVINLGDVYINSSNPANTNLAVDYKLQPGKVYEIRLYPWNSNGYSNVYLDNPRLFFNPVPATETTIACLSNLSGTVGSALEPYIDNDIPTGLQLRWLKDGIDATSSPIEIGSYIPVYYNSVSDCYSGTGSPVSVIECTSGPGLNPCYKPGITTGTALDTKVGMTALNRAGEDNSDNWPMNRKGGWIALEAKTKGFVPNRVEFDTSGNPVGIASANFVEGMMIYDNTNKCMKLYTIKDGDDSPAWHCIATQTCPE